MQITTSLLGLKKSIFDYCSTHPKAHLFFVLSTFVYYLFQRKQFNIKKNGLKGSIVWITGATSGIGEQLAYDFAKLGCKLVLSARRKNELERVKASCERIYKHFHGSDSSQDICLIIELDMKETDSFTKDVNLVLQTFNRIDILINNAGLTTRAFAYEITMPVVRNVIDTNTIGCIALTRAILPHMITQNSGQIITISSVAGLIGTPLRSIYCASKFALHGFFDSLRLEVLDYNIHVGLVCPGPVQTAVAHNALLADGSRSGKSDSFIENGMSVKKCCDIIVNQSVINRKNQILVLPLSMRILFFLRSLPFSHFIEKAFARSMIKHHLANQ
eukprot:TRINITY_DN5365_c2_g1_i1.p1 TRINITY_DN5365_c2_g1~~TRINITY_DN5365_c2_g1_i1.p1  ORF type:complete len:331 (-),score=132.69 TRINITY_DN5365_c2_g1_i1:79-1071(-)